MSHTLVEHAIVRWLGVQDYQETWHKMQEFTQNRDHDTIDEFWLLEHNPVYTFGQNAKAEHLLTANAIPVVRTDRGGQITYHGPGQLMLYTLIDVKRRQLGIRQLVSHLEQAVIDALDTYGVHAFAKREAPGVYVAQGTPLQDKKICSIGLRIRRGCAYHGIALNVGMDLRPFTHINPCGFAGLQMTQVSELGGPHQVNKVGQELVDHLLSNLGYTQRLSSASDVNITDQLASHREG